MDDPAVTPGWRGWLRSETLYLLEILAVAGFTVTRPLLDVFGRDPATFLAAGATRAAIVVFALAVALLPALALWAPAALTRLGGAALRRAAQVAVVGGLLVLFAHAEIARTVGWPRALNWGLSLALAVGFGVLYLRVAPTRTFLHYASAGTAVFLALFLFASPVSDLLGSSTASAAGARAARAPVVWIVFDEFPTTSLLDGHGRIDAQLFPGLAELAHDGTWYRNNTTVSAFTNRAVPAIVTGRYPPDGSPSPTVDSYPQNAFTLLGASHEVHAEESLTHLCPANICTRRRTSSVAHATRALVEQARRVWRDRAKGVSGSGADRFEVDDDLLGRRDEAFRRFLSGVASPRTGSRPSFDFAHIVLPHTPLEYLPDGKRYDQERDGFVIAGWASPDAARIGLQRHLLQAQLADRYVGRVVSTLRARGVYDDALIVVTADHGASYRSRVRMRGFSDNNLVDVAFSPLFIKAPHQERGGPDDRNAETIDVLPTVADLLDVELPWPVDGVSLAGEPRSRPTKRVDITRLDRIEPDRGNLHVFDGTRLFRTLLRTPAATPPGPPELRIFRTGRYGSLVGRRVDELPAGAPSTVEAHIVNGPAIHDPRSDRVPVYVQAHVSPADVVTVIAVNGRIGAWMPSWRTDRRVNLWGIVPESFLRPGPNDVRLYEVEGTPLQPVLRPIGSPSG